MSSGGFFGPTTFGDGNLKPSISAGGSSSPALDFSQAANSQYWFLGFLI